MAALLPLTLRRAWLRMRIRAAEADCEALQAQLTAAPACLTAWLCDIADMRRELEALEQEPRETRRPVPSWLAISTLAGAAAVAWAFWQ